MSYIQNIGPEFYVQGCDIARACEGYQYTRRGQNLWTNSFMAS